MSNELTASPKPPVNIDDLLDSATKEAPSLVDEDDTYADKDPPDVEREIERCKAYQASRSKNHPNPPVPVAHYFVVCGEHMIFMPPTAEQYERLVKTSANESIRHKAGRQLCSDTIFWIRGQKEVGPRGAWEHIKNVSAQGGAKVLLIDRCAGALLDQLNAAAGDDVLKKR